MTPATPQDHRLRHVAELLASGLLDFGVGASPNATMDWLVETILNTPIEVEVLASGKLLLDRLLADHRSPPLLPERSKVVPRSTGAKRMSRTLNQGQLIDRDQALKSLAMKICRRCGLSFPLADFPGAMARGKYTIRSWCAGCLKAYYTENSRQRKARRLAQLEVTTR